LRSPVSCSCDCVAVVGGGGMGKFFIFVEYGDATDLDTAKLASPQSPPVD
jgi:hypothetical protein